MKLIDNWKSILKKAWSVRLMLLSGVLSGLEGIVPLFIDSMPRGRFAVLALTVSIGAMLARVLAQEGVTK